MARKTLAAVIVAAVALGGCSTWFKDKDKALPTVSLPQKPVSSTVPCEDLTAEQEAVCLREPNDQARDVCRKVQRNKAICDDRGEFVDRLYDARDAT